MMNQSPGGEIPRPPQLPIDSEQLSYGFTEADLTLDPLTIDRAPGLEIFKLLSQITDPTYTQYDRSARYRTMNMALALFTKLSQDTAFDGLYYNDILAAALDTAIIWEVG